VALIMRNQFTKRVTWFVATPTIVTTPIFRPPEMPATSGDEPVDANESSRALATTN